MSRKNTGHTPPKTFKTFNKLKQDNLLVSLLHLNLIVVPLLVYSKPSKQDLVRVPVVPLLVYLVREPIVPRTPHGYRSIQVTRQVDPKYSGQVIKFMTQYQVRLQV